MDKSTLEKLKTLSILYVEDEEGIRKKIADSLRYYVAEVIEAVDGKEGWEFYKKHNPDIVFTDIMMPKIDGIELAKKIRSEDTSTPLVMVTAHTDKEYLLSAVELHLEQYIIKPINLRDLKKCLEKCIHVISKNNAICKELPYGYSYDFDHKVLTCKEEEIKLSKKEIAFFELLLKNKHRVVSYEEMQEYVWGDDFMTDGALKALVRNLRQKFPKECIKNLSGVGYRLVDC